jgi:tRNA threonylcarbamoyladenosine biosynthesis protein TsaE
MKYTSKSPEETRQIAEEFINTLTPQDAAVVIALIGDLGAGKTVFSQAVGEHLGVRDLIQSPTFLIEKIYELHKASWEHLVHIDAYRLESPVELVSLGWEAIIKRPENLIIVEWADKVESILPPGAYHISIYHVDENTREIEINTEDPRTA